jgi:ribosomal protein L32
MEGPVYWCKLCEKYIRTNTECPECGTAGQKVGWIHSNEEM